MYLQRRRSTKSFARDCFFILLLFFYVLFFCIIILITCYRYIDIYATYIICGVRRVNDVRDMCADYVARIYTRGAYNVEKKNMFYFFIYFFFIVLVELQTLYARLLCVSRYGGDGVSGAPRSSTAVYTLVV